jgi:peptidoglycan L-alanyl-D-glutamate endopeptidase CwlK
MNKYSRNSARRVNECHDDLKLIFAIVLLSYDHAVLTGERGKDAQNAAFKAGRSKVQWPNSKHNSTPSMAIDASPYPIPKNWGDGDRNELEKFRYFAFYVIGVADTLYHAGITTHTVRWGGDWDSDKDVTDQTFDDLVHFELREMK